MRRLFGDAGEERAQLLGLNDADGVAVHEQEVVTGTGLEGRLAQGNAAAGAGGKLPVILDGPPARQELRVNLLAGALFRGQFRHCTCGRAHDNTSQRPPLSGPMRRRRPKSLSLARWFLTARPLRPSRAPRPAMVSSGSARSSSRIFRELFWAFFWEP